MTGHLTVTDEDALRIITLRRPEKKNALTQDMYRAMSEAIDAAQENPAIRCIVITGGPGAFTGDNDLQDFLKDGRSKPDTPRALPTFPRTRSGRTSPRGGSSGCWKIGARRFRATTFIIQAAGNRRRRSPCWSMHRATAASAGSFVKSLC